MALRLTGLYALRRLSAARATKKHSRACALCAFFLRHIFCAPELLRNSSIAHKKRRIQLERYVPFFWVSSKILFTYLNKYINKNYRVNYARLENRKKLNIKLLIDIF
jgi:hypothetical protein